MGQSKRSTTQFLLANPWCIFCGGTTPATSREHCPPRSLFEDRAWPEGFEFPACDACNGGSSDDDLLVAFLAHTGPDPTIAKRRSPPWLGLMQRVKQQKPGLLDRLRLDATEARRAARAIGIKPAPGQTYRDLPLFKVPAELNDAVMRFAGKLTRATFFMATDQVFPLGGGIMFHWFTNGSQTDEDGVPVALAAFAQLIAKEPALRRGGKDLSEQFSLRVSLGEQDGEHLFVVQATFRRTFGFVCIAAAKSGQAERMLAEVAAARGGGSSPFTLLPPMR
jgi:hypothetical protein